MVWIYILDMCLKSMNWRLQQQHLPGVNELMALMWPATLLAPRGREGSPCERLWRGSGERRPLGGTLIPDSHTKDADLPVTSDRSVDQWQYSNGSRGAGGPLIVRDQWGPGNCGLDQSSGSVLFSVVSWWVRWWQASEEAMAWMTFFWMRIISHMLSVW